MSRPIKGLIIKDLKLIMSQMRLFIAIIIVWGVIMMTSIGGAFFVGYIALMFSFITLGTFTYDETEKGLAYIFTLPIMRKDYLREKYLLGFIISTLPSLVVSLISYIPFLVAGTNIPFLDYFLSSIITIPVVLFLLALQIPLYIKFGQEKRRIVTIISVGMISACLGALGSLYEMAGGDRMEIISSIRGLNIWWMTLLIVLVTIILIMVSYKISCFILERKQF